MKDSLLYALEELSKELNSSGVERTAGFLKKLGDKCPYYQKSMKILMDRHYDRIKELLAKVNEELK